MNALDIIWRHLSWSHALLIALLPLLAVGYVLTDSVEDPRAWRFLRMVRRHIVTRRARKLRRQPLDDPWSGAIVKRPTFYTPHWTPTVGRAYRAWAASMRASSPRRIDERRYRS